MAKQIHFSEYRNSLNVFGVILEKHSNPCLTNASSDGEGALRQMPGCRELQQEGRRMF